MTRFTASAVFIAVDTAHFAAHGDISGFWRDLRAVRATAAVPVTRHDRR